MKNPASRRQADDALVGHRDALGDAGRARGVHDVGEAVAGRAAGQPGGVLAGPQRLVAVDRQHRGALGGGAGAQPVAGQHHRRRGLLHHHLQPLAG